MTEFVLSDRFTRHCRGMTLKHREGRGSRLRMVMPALAALMTVITGPAKAQDVSLSWDEGRLAVPSRGLLRTRLGSPEAQAALAKARPGAVIVIYMHGCGGISNNSRSDLNFLAHSGFIAIAPNSLAWRKSNCDPKTKSTGYFREVTAYRQEEIAYALSKLRTMPNIDPRKLVLMGHSEGGKAAGIWKGTDFRAVIISGWDCYATKRDPGLQTPKSIPVMSIVMEKDEWTEHRYHGYCKRAMSDYPVHLNIIPPGEGHWILNQYYPQIKAFIDANTR